MPPEQRPPSPGRPDQPEIRPLGRSATRRFVILSILFVIAAGVGAGYYFVVSAQQPEVQERIERIRRLEAERDSVGRAEEAVSPDVLRDVLREDALQDTAGVRR